MAEFTLADLVRRTQAATARTMRVAMPARVVDYDSARSMVRVRIDQDEPDGAGGAISQPIVNEVPVSWPRSGGAWMTFPISAGDTGLVVFADRDIGAWVTDGARGLPESDRLHAHNDAIFIPGIRPGGVVADASAVEIGLGGATIRIEPGGIVRITASQVFIDAPLVEADGSPVSRIGDNVLVGGGSSAGLWPLVEGADG